MRQAGLVSEQQKDAPDGSVIPDLGRQFHTSRTGR
jgi:hypothetical protein